MPPITDVILQTVFQHLSNVKPKLRVSDRTVRPGGYLRLNIEQDAPHFPIQTISFFQDCCVQHIYNFKDFNHRIKYEYTDPEFPDNLYQAISNYRNHQEPT